MTFWTGTQFLEGYLRLCNSLAMWPWMSHPTWALTSSTKMKGWVQAPFNVCSFLWLTGFQYLPCLSHSYERNVIFRHQLSLCNNDALRLIGICYLQSTFISTIAFDFNKSCNVLRTSYLVLRLTGCETYQRYNMLEKGMTIVYTVLPTCGTIYWIASLPCGSGTNCLHLE